jgi:hypothetical protein
MGELVWFSFFCLSFDLLKIQVKFEDGKVRIHKEKKKKIFVSLCLCGYRMALSPTTTEASMSTPSISAAAMKRSGSGLACGTVKIE